MANLQDLIAQNSSNEDYLIGDVLLELLPIDFIKPSELGGTSVRICYEDSKQLENEFISAFKQIEELITNGTIHFSKTYNKDIIGSFGLMRLRTSPSHSDRLISIPTSLDVWEVICSHYSSL